MNHGGKNQWIVVSGENGVNRTMGVRAWGEEKQSESEGSERSEWSE
jgi:hypothetical protein